MKRRITYQCKICGQSSTRKYEIETCEKRCYKKKALYQKQRKCNHNYKTYKVAYKTRYCGWNPNRTFTMKYVDLRCDRCGRVTNMEQKVS